MKTLSRALIFDSVFDPYKGVLAYVKVIDGSFRAGESVYLIHSQTSFTPTEVGHFTPEYHPDTELSEGQIGYITTGQKSVRDVKIGDTILATDFKKNSLVANKEPSSKDSLKEYIIPGFKKITPYVYAGVYPIDSTEYDKLKDSLEKLSLNDSAIEYEMEDSGALGLGFRCGFLGMLHMDIIKERLRREYKLDTIFTIPTVVYLVKSKNLSIPQIKTGNNIKSLIATGLYETILRQEGIILEEAQKIKMEQSQGVSAEILTIQGKQIKKAENDQELLINGETLLALLKPRIVVKSGTEMIDQGMIEKIQEPI